MRLLYVQREDRTSQILCTSSIEFVLSLLNYMLICFRMYKMTKTVVIVYGLTLKVVCKVSRFASR